MREIITMPWKDIDLTTEQPTVINPINIRRTNLDQKITLEGLVTLTVYDTNKDNAIVTPPVQIDKAIVVDHIIKFELLNEFGVDMGLGFILGQAKR